MKIDEFLAARLAEDERAAHAAAPATGGPERVRADIEAKRRILSGYTATHRACMAAAAQGSAAPGDDAGAWSALHAWRRALEHLAAVYAAHPDYDPSWRP
ncbi:DUF6221 family protein [Streptomonospora nanhaiensis]|uniref:Uncharacterized protein n=1 Tax=Streptomonospora nanhaiensis TaxID=1323731 RepID=A0A853BSB1_9ACTN|nr:DUF6221 family protein [Streptomonospora nanhaiensis]MBV2365166.1 hypothetical protein [Streptomonospora nanhaiensis]MBV2366329.1 hypothetical protein [Streptomonospora nanhaiensis]MBX9391720.1 hypothetical protein [Streptomonospora nanhaiensis]NYI97437.1 hypothetical protein [Streptomonospora nanhaiensis]